MKIPLAKHERTFYLVPYEFPIFFPFFSRGRDRATSQGTWIIYGWWVLLGNLWRPFSHTQGLQKSH